MADFIPLCRPFVPQTGQAHLSRAVASPQQAGDGPFTSRCAALLAGELEGARVLMTPSCTAALELAALLLDLQPGDEVIFPAFTFVSTVNAFALRGVRPIFCDSRLDTCNLDETRLEGLITPRTKAVVVVHYGGVACAMEPIQALCRRHGLALVEDLAHGPFAQSHGRPLGTFGTFSTLSFHQTKNFSCGEGGALVINDPTFVERAEIVREKGTNRSRFFRGEVDKYTWVDLGSSFLLADLLAALLLGALEEREAIQAERMEIWNRYHETLKGPCQAAGIPLSQCPEGLAHSAHLFHLVMESSGQRQAFMDSLKIQGIQSAFHYQSLAEAPMGRSFGPQADPCPVAHELSERLVRLPLWNGLGAEGCERVLAATLGFLMA